MGEPAFDRSHEAADASQPERERAKPELRLVGKEVSPEQADSLIDRMVEEFDETADETVKEMVRDAKALEDLSESQDVPLNAEEANENAGITTRAEAAADRLRTEIAAATGKDLPGLDAQLRSLDQQLEAAVKAGDGAKRKELEARREEVDAERKKVMAETSAKKEANAAEPKAPEASVVVDFGQLLEHLSPEAQKKAADNYANADEASYGGLASKGMTPDGVVRLGYKDGTIVEVFPGGEKRSNLPGATGAERIPSLPEWMKGPAADASELSDEDRAGIELASVTVLEGDLAADKAELASIPAGQNAERAERLKARVAAAEDVLRRKNTPEGLAKEIADLNQYIADEEVDMKFAPASERAGHAGRIDQWKAEVKMLEDRIAVMGADEKAADYAAAITEVPPAQAEAKAAAPEQAAAPERTPAPERKARMQQLEETMRGLERKRKEAATPEERSAASRDLEAATKEWDDLRNGWTAEDDKSMNEFALAEAKRKRVQELEDRMRDLERQYQEAGSPDAKSAAARDLEAATREWDDLRRAATGEVASDAVEQAVAVAVAAEALAAAETEAAKVATPDGEPKPGISKAELKERLQKLKDARAGLAAAEASKKAPEQKPKKSKPSTEYAGGPGPADKGGKGEFGKKLEAAWDWAQKFFGGWTGIK